MAVLRERSDPISRVLSATQLKSGTAGVQTQEKKDNATKVGAGSVWLFKVLLGLCGRLLVSLTHKPPKFQFGRDLAGFPISRGKKLRPGKKHQGW